MRADPLAALLRQLFDVTEVLPVGRAALGIAAALSAWAGGRALRVAVPAAVCQDVIAAVRLAACIPVCCDIDPATGITSAAQWQQARADGAEAAIVVHLYGNPAQTAAARAAFPAPECLLIDDAAQALGVRTATGLAGTEGDVGVLSFGQTKHIAVGGGALLLRDRHLAAACAAALRPLTPRSDSADFSLQNFRRGLQAARDRWIAQGDIRGFDGLLDGLETTLAADWDPAWTPSIVAALHAYPSRVADRLAKADGWRQALRETPLQPVGMQRTSQGISIPWRYACRVAGIEAPEQHAIGCALRASGLQVSHWYLPTHWMLGAGVGSLPGVELLAQQVFQFWVDETTPMPAIVQAGAAVRRTFATQASRTREPA